MEKFYKITNAKLFEEVAKYMKISKERNEFAQKFFKEHDIDGNEYYFGGTGCCNCAFEEYNKKNITLAISNTENNIANYENDFKKYKLCETLYEFKKSAKLLKEFQDECVKQNVIINLLRIRIGDYFKELHMGGYSTSGLDEFDNAYYLKVSTDRFDSITPQYDGFEELKGSEYYAIVENL